LVERIVRNYLHKAIISRRLAVPFTVDLPATYLDGLTRNRPARSFLFDIGGFRAAGFSPEIVVSVGPDGTVATQPLAGTRPMRAAAEETLELRQELVWDVKELYEHVVSVRLATEELLGVCHPDSVVVRDLLDVKERGSVQHLASRVLGRLSPGLDAWDALTALFPAVTASGIPKREALEVIRELEPVDRGLYSGAVCAVDPHGQLDAAIVLRTVFQDGCGSWLQAGAGIVEGSDPAAEFDETANKLRSVSHSLIEADPTPSPAPPRALELGGIPT
jgi:salicylate synthetase